MQIVPAGVGVQRSNNEHTDMDTTVHNIQTHSHSNKHNNCNGYERFEQDVNTVTLYYDTAEEASRAHVNAVQRGLITEIYLPPRLVKFATRHGLELGHSIDTKFNDRD